MPVESWFVIGPNETSWVEGANGSGFPIQNLPFGVGSREGEEAHVVVRIGDSALDLFEAASAGLVDADPSRLSRNLNGLSIEEMRRLRRRSFELLSGQDSAFREDPKLRQRALVRCVELEMRVPYEIRSFVDFYSGIHHASNVGRMFRPEQPPLLPNYRSVPVAYNGRSSTVLPSGTPISRPRGQIKFPDREQPEFLPTRELDFEVELGVFLGRGSDLGSPISVDDAEAHIAGVVLVNDWSARDVQRWEYQPLGPFLAKSFATSVSPWLVTLDALRLARRPAPLQEPSPLQYLSSTDLHLYDIQIEVGLHTAKMERPQVVSRCSGLDLYWSFAQQIAHLTSNGCRTEVGDLAATGTISGSEPGTFGSLLELSWKGTQPIALAETGESRTFLEDGDTLVMTGYAEANGVRIGFGEVRGTVLPSS